MSSSEVGLFALEAWKTSGAPLRSYRVIGGIALQMPRVMKVESIDPTGKSVTFAKDGGTESWTLDLSDVQFEYAAEDDDVPESVSQVFVGRFLKISMPGIGVVVLGELPV